MASNTTIFDFFNSLPNGFTNEEFEDRISECPATLRQFKRSLANCKERSKLETTNETGYIKQFIFELINSFF